MASNINGVQQVAQSLYEQHGKIETKALVDAARPKDSPAHDAFEWDNNKAGEEYRLLQARKYIRVIKVIKHDEPERLIHVPSVRFNQTQPDAKDGHYQVASVLINQPDEFQRAINAAAMRMNSANHALNELYSVAESTDRTDKIALIAEMTKATRMFSDALRAMH